MMRFTVASFFVLLIWACGGNTNDEVLLTDQQDTIEQVPEIVLDGFGVPVNTHKIVSKKVKRNQTFAKILYKQDLDHRLVYEMVQACEDTFDLRKIKRKQAYHLYYDTIHNQLEYFIYEIDRINYLKFDLQDTVLLSFESKEVDTVRQFAVLNIQSSLWNAVIDGGYSTVLPGAMSEVFAWTVDFFGLKKGDSMRVFYDELMIEDERVGFQEIVAAEFLHNNQTYFAIPFEQDGQIDFYDADGSSLRKAFLKAPLKFSRISSKFSYNRLHPILKIRRPHLGIDYAAPSGTPVLSIGDGVVVKSQYSGGAGHMVTIKHNGTYTTKYLHLKGYGKGIKKGVRVKQGQVIGYVGSTGLSTGPHLDFRVYKDGKAMDPLKLKAPPVSPVKEENESAFEATKGQIIEYLNSGIWAE